MKLKPVAVEQKQEKETNSSSFEPRNPFNF